MVLSNYTTKYFGGNRTLSSYLNDIRKYKVPTNEEEVELFERVGEGDNEAIKELVERNQRFVYAFAKIYAKNEDEVLDYVNEGNIGLLDAIKTFDLTLGFKFITHAAPYIRREMNHYLTTTNRQIKRTNSTKYAKKIDKTREAYFAKHGVYPTDEQILDIINKDGIVLRNKDDVSEVVMVSISDSYNDDSDYTVEDNEAFNNKTSSHIKYDEKVDDDYNHALIDNILSSIPERNRKIIKLLFGIGIERPLSLKEVGEIYNLDEVSISKIKTTSLAYLKQERRTVKMVI